MDYKKYNNTKLFLKITQASLSFVLLLSFVILGYSKDLEVYLKSTVGTPILVFLTFVIITGILFSLILFPLNFYSGFILEHKYNLSNQSLRKWILEMIKGSLVGTLISVPVLLFFYFSLHQFKSLWWLPFAIFIFIFSVILARIVPVFILPIFYKIIPLNNPELTDRIFQLAVGSKLNIENIYEFDMSKNTKKANAAFTGIGKSRRIILGDTLLSCFSINEILTVIAHEIGHFERKHIIKNIVLSTFLCFFSLYIIAFTYNISLPIFNFVDITELAALPLLILIAALISLITTPLSNYFSRKFEYEADEYAVTKTRSPDDYSITLMKLTEQNLGDKNPHPFVEWFWYSHPSINKRILHIKSIAANNKILFLSGESI